MERLQKVLANAGVASRRKCEELIAAGKVEVNDEVVTTLGAKVDPAVDVIKVNGKAIANENKVYYMINKPKGVITSLVDPEGRQTIKDYIKHIPERVYPVGRLDYDSEGLVLLTNDGELANMLTHPKFHVPKTYYVSVNGIPHGDILEKLRQGIKLEDGMTAPAEVEYQDIDMDNKKTVLRITIYEGRNRQVRRMMDAVHFPVNKLKRVAFGPVRLDKLQRGKARRLTAEELNDLKNACGKTQKSHKK